MTSRRTATGIDVGSHAIKVAQLRRVGANVEALNLGMTSVRYAEAGEGAEAGDRAAELSGHLRTLLRSMRCSARSAQTAVGGRRVIIRYSNAPFVPAWQLSMMMQYQIEGETMGGTEQNAADYRPLNIPAAKDLRLMIGMAKNEAVTEHMRVLAGAGVRTRDVTLTALAVAATYAHTTAEPDEEEISCLLNIGADNTDLVIIRGRNIYFARSITTGSRAFTEALRSELDLDFEQAEQVKLAHGRILPEQPAPRPAGETSLENEQGGAPEQGPAGAAEPPAPATPEQRRISEALIRAASGLVAQVQVSLSACRSATGMTTMRVDRVFLSGGGAAVAGLKEFLSERLRLPVQLLPCFNRINTAGLPADARKEVEKNPMAYAVAIGLALQQVFPELFHLSLLPKRVKERREFFARRIYLWVAAIVYAAALAGAAFGSAVVTRERGGQVRAMAAAVQKAEQQMARAQSLKVENETLSAEVGALATRLNAAHHTLRFFGLMRQLTPPQLQVFRVETYSGDTSRYERPKPVLTPAALLALKSQPPPPKVLVIMGRVMLKPPRPGLFEEINLVAAQNLVRQYAEQLQHAGGFRKLEQPLAPSEQNLEFRIELTMEPGTL